MVNARPCVSCSRVQRTFPREGDEIRLEAVPRQALDEAKRPHLGPTELQMVQGIRESQWPLPAARSLVNLQRCLVGGRQPVALASTALKALVEPRGIRIALV
jgi:hypothetical protein